MVVSVKIQVEPSVFFRFSFLDIYFIVLIFLFNYILILKIDLCNSIDIFHRLYHRIKFNCVQAVLCEFTKPLFIYHKELFYSNTHHIPFVIFTNCSLSTHFTTLYW